MNGFLLDTCLSIVPSLGDKTFRTICSASKKIINLDQYKNKNHYLFATPDIEFFKNIGISGKTAINFSKKSFSVNNTARPNNFLKSKLPPNNTVGYPPSQIQQNSTFLMTALPFSTTNKKDYYFEIGEGYPVLNIKKRNEEIAQNKQFIYIFYIKNKILSYMSIL